MTSLPNADPFSAATKTVMELARKKAFSMGFPHTSTGYVLVALIQQEESPLAENLKSLGLDACQVSDYLKTNWWTAEPRAKEEPEKFSPSPMLYDAISVANWLAKDAKICRELLCLAMLTLGASEFSVVLREFHVDTALLRKQLVAAMTAQPMALAS